MNAAAPTMSNSSGRKWLALALGTRSTSRATDLALAVLRLGLGWIFFVYGSQKLFGWFGGPGIDPTASFMASIGLKPGTFMAYLSGIIEFGGGIAMLLGVAVRLAALALIGDMVMAMIKVTAEQGLHPYTNAPGYGLNVALIAMAIVMFLVGAGRYSLDSMLERRLVAEG